MLHKKRWLYLIAALILVGPLLVAGARRLKAAPAPARGKASMASLIALPDHGMAEAPAISSGDLRFFAKDGTYGGSCPLKHTDVSAEVSGFVSRVTVTQEFTNPSREPIEAVYVFPLSDGAAVDRMTMTIGDRVIKGEIKRREEARQIYEQAKAEGKRASLLDQERPNIFTQSVANILPGDKVLITLSYTEALKFQDGSYEFSFPTVVGPRYIPGGTPRPTPPIKGRPIPLTGGPASSAPGSGPAASLATVTPPGNLRSRPVPETPSTTGVVTDADRITPPVTPPNTRAGHDLSIQVKLDAGVPLGEIRSLLHPIAITRIDSTTAQVKLKDQDVLPNKDFILRFGVAGGQVRSGVLAHTRAQGDGYFTLVFQPPPKPARDWVTPKEMVFVIDTSGSQMGWPIEKAKETMKLCVQQMNPDDTFQMLAFSNTVTPLFQSPQPNIARTRTEALDFLTNRLGNGGTEMLPAVLAALDIPPDPKRLRIVCFMTDGYVGNDFQIVDAVQKHLGGARLFSFGIGNSVNRFLLDKMAEEGRGAVEYVTLDTPGSEPAKRFAERIANPLLTDIKVDWSGLEVNDLYPSRLPDLFSSGPVVLTGRYSRAGSGAVRVSGFLGGKPWSETLDVLLPGREAQHDALAPLWARARIDDLSSQDWMGQQTGGPRQDVKEQITQLALDYNLMSQYTSFVAVENLKVTDGGKTRLVPVPVEMPEGVSYEGIFGEESKQDASVRQRLSRRATGFAYGGAGGGLSSYAAKAPVPGLRPATPLSSSLGVTAAPQATTQNYALSESEALDSIEVRKDSPAKPLDKLDPGLRALLPGEKPASGSGPAPKVTKGKVEVQIRLTDVSQKTVDALKALGVEVLATSKATKVVVARVPVAKLEAIAKLVQVRRISPVALS
ncbi:MAG TPA: VIT domain-containing protein [Armatimonadota bacterium]